MDYLIVYEDESGLIYKEVAINGSFEHVLRVARANSDIGDTFKIYQDGIDGYIHGELVI